MDGQTDGRGRLACLLCRADGTATQLNPTSLLEVFLKPDLEPDTYTEHI